MIGVRMDERGEIGIEGDSRLACTQRAPPESSNQLSGDSIAVQEAVCSVRVLDCCVLRTAKDAQRPVDNYVAIEDARIPDRSRRH